MDDIEYLYAYFKKKSLYDLIPGAFLVFDQSQSFLFQLNKTDNFNLISALFDSNVICQKVSE